MTEVIFIQARSARQRLNRMMFRFGVSGFLVGVGILIGRIW